MGRTTGFLQKGYTAGGTITARRFVKFGAADGAVIQAVAATSAIIGVQSELSIVAGERASVAMVGNIEDVDFGGTITRGDPLTSDANGKAIKATTTGQFIAGFAEVSGVSGDIGTVILSPGVFAASA